MLYWLLVPLREYYFFFNVFRYITVRTALSGITALLLMIPGIVLLLIMERYLKAEYLSSFGRI